jgi:4-amino-4-deoxy-L-arabinose transferase-like glycosyltransferase
VAERSDIAATALTRGDVLFVAIVTLIGGILRFAGLTDTGLTHYDEGVYVLWAGAGGFPAKELFAPPLFPMILRAAFAITGPRDSAALAVSAAFGTAAIPVIWWIAQRWFGSVAAWAAAVMAASSGFDIAFSRTALTDATFRFWFVVAIALATELFDSCSVSRSGQAREERRLRLQRPWLIAILLGLAIGLAWTTKYNGVLLIPIVAAPIVAAVLLRRRDGEFGWRAVIVHWCTSVAVAVAITSPWLVLVSRSLETGLSGLLAHQRGYSSGLAAWPSNFVTILANHWCITPWIGRLGPGLAAAVAIGRWKGHRKWPTLSESGFVVSLCLLVLVLGDSAAWIVGLPFALIRLRDRTAGSALLAAWLLAFFILTPLYRPYARLMMPLTTAGWIAAGGAIQSFLRFADSPSGRRYSGLWPLTCGSIVTAAVAACTNLLPLELEPARQTPAAVRSALRPEPEPSNSANWATRLRSVRVDGAVVSFVRPNVLFYLLREWQVVPVADLSFLERAGSDSSARFLCVDFALLRDTPDARQQLARNRTRLELVARWEYAPSTVTLLDDFGRQCIRYELRSPNVSDGISTPHQPDRYHIYYASPLATDGSLDAYPYQIVLYRVLAKSE